MKVNRKLVVNIVGLVIGIGLLVALYIMYARPKIKVWREAKSEVQQREKRLKELRKDFGNQRDPKGEIRTLQAEVENLQRANEAIEKIKTPGTETKDLPVDLQDPDPDIRKELYRDYMKEVMAVAEDRLKNKLKEAEISPPSFELYEELEDAEEAAYYMNRASGLDGIVEALAKTQIEGGDIRFEDISFENYSAGRKRARGAMNIMSYLLELTMDTKSLVAFLYNLQEEDTYHFVESMDIKPASTRQGSEGQRLEVSTRINTTMVFESKVKAQVAAAVQNSAAKQGIKVSNPMGWIGNLAKGIKEAQEKGALEEKKKWYEFWKWFKK